MTDIDKPETHPEDLVTLNINDITNPGKVPIPSAAIKPGSGSYFVEPPKPVEDLFPWGIAHTLNNNTTVRLKAENWEEHLEAAIAYYKEKKYLYYAEMPIGMPGVQHDYYFTTHTHPKSAVSSGLEWIPIDEALIPKKDPVPSPTEGLYYAPHKKRNFVRKLKNIFRKRK